MWTCPLSHRVVAHITASLKQKSTYMLTEAYRRAAACIRSYEYRDSAFCTQAPPLARHRREVHRPPTDRDLPQRCA